MNPAVRNIARWAAGLCAGCLVLSMAAAEEYSWQVSGSYRDENAANSVQAHSRNSRLLRATYYLSGVDDEVGPYELAPFLNRSSYVAVGAGRTKLREKAYPSFATPDLLGNSIPTGGGIGMFGPVNVWGSAFPVESGIDASEYEVGGRYVWPESGWYAGARARRSDADVLPQLPFFRKTAEFRRTGLFAGWYFGPRSTVEVGLGSESMSQFERAGPFANPLLGLPVPVGMSSVVRLAPVGFRIVTDEETESARFSVRHVGEVGGSTFELSASVHASRTDARVSVPLAVDFVAASNPFDPPDDELIGVVGGPAIEGGWSEREHEIRLSGALFPDEALGVRLTLSTSDHDAYGTGDRVGLSATWFFVRNAAVAIELMRSDSGRGYAPDSNVTDSVGVRVLGRF